MLAGTIALEDNTLHFSLHHGPGIPGAYPWTLTVADNQAGLEVSIRVSEQELGATLALALGSDDMPGAASLYPLAEAVAERLEIRARSLAQAHNYEHQPNCFRLIP